MIAVDDESSPEAFAKRRAISPAKAVAGTLTASSLTMCKELEPFAFTGI